MQYVIIHNYNFCYNCYKHVWEQIQLTLVKHTSASWEPKCTGALERGLQAMNIHYALDSGQCHL